MVQRVGVYLIERNVWRNSPQTYDAGKRKAGNWLIGVLPTKSVYYASLPSAGNRSPPATEFAEPRSQSGVNHVHLALSAG